MKTITIPYEEYLELQKIYDIVKKGHKGMCESELPNNEREIHIFNQELFNYYKELENPVIRIERIVIRGN